MSKDQKCEVFGRDHMGYEAVIEGPFASVPESEDNGFEVGDKEDAGNLFSIYQVTRTLSSILSNHHLC